MCCRWELLEMLRRLVLVGLLVVFKPGTIYQIFCGTSFCAAYLMIQLQARPYVRLLDNYLALAASFSLLMLMLVSILYKYDALITVPDLQHKMSHEQRANFIISPLALSCFLFIAVFGSLVAAAVLLVAQVGIEQVRSARLAREAHARRLRYVKDHSAVEAPPADASNFHLFLSQCAYSSQIYRNARHPTADCGAAVVYSLRLPLVHKPNRGLLAFQLAACLDVHAVSGERVKIRCVLSSSGCLR